MLDRFEAFQLAKVFYLKCKQLRIPSFLYNQLMTASSSIALNLAEGSGKRTPADQRRFYSIALGSLRECQAILELEEITNPEIKEISNRLGAIIFKLSRNPFQRRKTPPET